MDLSAILWILVGAVSVIFFKDVLVSIIHRLQHPHRWSCPTCGFSTTSNKEQFVVQTREHHIRTEHPDDRRFR